MKLYESHKAYLNGFKDGLNLNQNYPKTVMFMGYTMDELSEIISKHETEKFYSGIQWEKAEINKDKEKKMTRKEAEKVLYKLGTHRDTDGKYYILTVLEALGLIKFDEPELTPMEIFKKIYNEYKSGLTAEAFVNRLNNEGVFIKK